MIKVQLTTYLGHSVDSFSQFALYEGKMIKRLIFETFSFINDVTLLTFPVLDTVILIVKLMYIPNAWSPLTLTLIRPIRLEWL